MIELLYKVEIHFEENEVYFGKKPGLTVSTALSCWLATQPTNLGFKVHEYDHFTYPYVECYCKNISQAREWQALLIKKINEYGGTVLKEEDDDA